MLATMLLLAVFVAPPPAFGPPILCHPLVIGDARSLPFGEGAFDVDPDFDRHLTTETTLAVLDGTRDPLVHMETLRRAVVYVSAIHGTGTTLAAEQGELLAALRARVDRAEGETGQAPALVVACQPDPGRRPEPARGSRASEADCGTPGDRCRGPCDTGLAAFDLAYLLAALAEAGVEPDDGESRALLLEQALAHGEGQGGIQLGAALVHFSAGDRSRASRHGLAALELAGSRSLLEQSACRTLGPFMGAKTRDGLVDALTRLTGY